MCIHVLHVHACMIIHVLTVEPLAPACTISCRELLGNGLCKPTGIQALDMREGERESNNKRKDQERMEAHAHVHVQITTKRYM